MIVIGATEIWPSDQKTRATKMFTTFFFFCTKYTFNPAKTYMYII